VWPRFKLKETVSKRNEIDLLASFLEIAPESRKNYRIVELSETDIEFILCKKAFELTINKHMNFHDQNYVPEHKVVKVEKIFNESIFEKFTLELRKNLQKYPNKSTWDLVRLLFHGTSGTAPKDVYTSDYGLDFRFSNDGLYGNGIYFANNSNYSVSYQH